MEINLIFFEAYRSDNFIIGLTDVSPTVTAPVLWNYAVCGQYPGAVGSGATVSLKCAYNMTAYRYVIVQSPLTNEYANFCELEVYVSRKFIHRPRVTWQLTDRRVKEAKIYYMLTANGRINTRSLPLNNKMKIVLKGSMLLVPWHHTMHVAIGVSAGEKGGD